MPVISHILGNFEVGKSISKTSKKANSTDYAALLLHLKDKKNYASLREKNLEITKQKIKESVGVDQLISQGMHSIEEIDRSIQLHTKRLSEWYGYYYPSFEVNNPKKFVELVVAKDRKELLGGKKDLMGADLSSADISALRLLGKEVLSLYALKEKLEQYLSTLMKKHCPNLLSLCGVLLGAKLLTHTGSLKKLMLMPASTIQILGAEKALFRHLKTGARAPRHGYIIEHPLIANASQKEHGKRARGLANAISRCLKLDYFKGSFDAENIRKDLEKKFNVK